MPKRTDIKSILVIGAGPIVIGQACEFDYSGTQACKVLRSEGYRIVLVNSNPATIMTDPETADATYIEPITPAFVEKIIAKERPDALLPTMGGQTALNTAKALAESGVLDKYGVELIGAKLPAIDKAEDRALFREAMLKIGLDMPKSVVVRSMEQARQALELTGLPAIIRPSFTLGGTGGGIAYNKEEFERIVASGLDASPITEVLVEESVLGWKEYEMEVVRDKADNCIIICSIENVDPMGVHTGDSITVAPALTLTDKEYQRMRSASIAVLREVGVDTGGSNVQFAIDPASGRMVVIEMNPRVSRSSALASKATGFPIAKVAALLAVGYTLDEIQNDITEVTPASFEPSIDYVVTKIPRFTFEKFPETEPLLSTAMKSVGEVMAIGRTFQESVQKALRGLETGLSGFDEIELPEGVEPKEALVEMLGQPTPDRFRVAAQALREGMSVEEIQRITRFDPWFLRQVEEIVQAEAQVRALGLPEDRAGLHALKGMGFSDKRLGKLTGLDEAEVRTRRHALKVHPVFKRIDTCAAEFESQTPYMYSTYEAPAFGEDEAEDESRPSDRTKVIILGGGPNRIGQGIEFDYCCVHAAFGLKDAGFETVMVNCNPETVSTDPDTSDRLYFEPLTAEDVLEICAKEASNGKLLGCIVQLGGQTPLKLSHHLEKAGIPILGTPVDSIDLAEDRERFQGLLQQLGLKQPENATAASAEEAVRHANALGYPVMLRPSYVLGGRAMRIVHDEIEAKAFAKEAAAVSEQGAVLVDRYLSDAIEVDVDVIADGEASVVAGVMEHIEEAGVHSGDSACSLPPYSLTDDVVAEIERQAKALAKALNVRGLMNVQFAVKDKVVYILEVNPRASRTVPFVAKAIGKQLAKMAARIMAGEPLGSFDLDIRRQDHVAVKEAVFPFARFPGVDLILGPEMKSTGEVMGLDHDFGRAFLKGQIASGQELPQSGAVFLSVRDQDKAAAVEIGRRLVGLGYGLLATRGTATVLRAADVPVQEINKVHEGRPHIVDRIKDKGVVLMINTTDGRQAIKDSYSLRREALMNRVPYTTTIAGARAVVQALGALTSGDLAVAPLQAYFELSRADDVVFQGARGA
ncbi:MAG TPA: carbamoyl-phosphate synthase large subunit [Geminicoccus sp.]|uniref:carbamoyl-phosphate synthase large subunit n=1 Tax=Geminicoccus sp. TaxID=2024832 RepID=UPI002B5B757F|nr:carbamoyl-phosphate synthase large subunit [Geminicoccus sp.]HWL68509.1 carbamoyl-phosphate synthase large subunit [Geminicoccus sp.]